MWLDGNIDGISPTVTVQNNENISERSHPEDRAGNSNKHRLTEDIQRPEESRKCQCNFF